MGIQAGLHWGELVELRLRDLDPPTRMLTIARTVVELRPRFHPSGGRFLVKDYPKNRQVRRIKISHSLVIRLTAFAMARCLGSDDLLSPRPSCPGARRYESCRMRGTWARRNRMRLGADTGTAR